MRLFAALTGESAERVTEPEVFLQALRKIGDGAAEMARQLAHGGGEGEAARARLRAIARTMREHGIAVPGGGDASGRVEAPLHTDHPA